MISKLLKRPRDPVALAKDIGDITQPGHRFTIQT